MRENVLGCAAHPTSADPPGGRGPGRDDGVRTSVSPGVGTDACLLLPGGGFVCVTPGVPEKTSEGALDWGVSFRALGSFFPWEASRLPRGRVGRASVDGPGTEVAEGPPLEP
ncbi:hypothetical protein GCM10012319_21750 [Comamonas sp. KCTC 72670]|nr:hypothetical protein GCM10012319_21750 [Comamonas sp. KCTC 72670]